MALYKFCIIIIIIIIVIIITFISVVLLLVHRFICSVLLLTYASSSTKNCHLLTMSVALLADVSTDWSSCVRSHTNTHFGHQNRYGECSGHQPHWLLQRSHVCRAWPSSPTATRNAHSVGADDLSAQKIRPRHRSILFDTLYWLPSVKRWSTNYTRSSASAFMAWSHRTLWICDNQFPMSLAVAVYVPQPAVIWLSREPKSRLMDLAVFQCRPSGPTSWNSLPQSFRDATLKLRKFQRRLKTSLFRLAYVRDLTAHSRLSRLLEQRNINVRTEMNRTECGSWYVYLHWCLHISLMN